MAQVPEIMLDTLEQLVEAELRTFQWYICRGVLQGFVSIPRARLDGVDRLSTVDVLVQTYGYNDAVSVSVEVLMKMNLRLWAETLKKKFDEVASAQVGKEISQHALQEKLKSTLREKYQNIYEGNTDEGDTIYLNKIYTELHLIEGISKEHEVRQLSSNHVVTEESCIKACDIFKLRSKREKQIRTVLTLGIAGVGKTVSAQKYTLSWAEGEENQDIHFLFPLPFHELNPNIHGKDCSLMQLLHQFFPEIKPMETLGKESKVLFIFDGLDESRLPLNFKHNRVLRDESEPAPLDVVITNLITGGLLGNALIWITSRPAAAGRIPRKHIHQWTEVKGFNVEQREEYFQRHLHDDNLAVRIINHVKQSRSLYIMCQIPVFCWITAKTDRMRKGDYPMSSDNVVLKLAELAFRQLENGELIFYESDLKECGMDIEEATIYSGVCTEVFLMDGRGRRKVFRFVHLTIQEFLAAVYAHHSYLQRRDNVLLGYLRRISTRWFPKSVFGFHKTAIDRALESQDGHWDLFLRFLLGLSLKSNQELLGRVLNMKTEGEEKEVEKTIHFIKEKIKDEPETKINLFHCLSELKDASLVQEIQSFVSSGRLLPKQLSPVQWSALTFELMTSEATEKEFDLRKYMRSDEGVVKLLTVISSSTRALLSCCSLTKNCCEVLASALSSTCSRLIELDLSKNYLTDSGVKLLSVGLRGSHCKLKSLSLHECKLKGDCCEALAIALSAESTQLRELDLSCNALNEAGMKALCVGLCSDHCKLETLGLSQCKLRENSCAHLASALSSASSHLKKLDLSNNSLKDSGLSLLSAGLRSPHCRLETLRLSWCGLTEKCCDQIGSVLGSDSSTLRELDLTGNKLQGPGLQLLSIGLRSLHCTLWTLRLNECKLTKCCADLASVLNCSSSQLKNMHLSGNDLQDSEVKLLSAGLASLDCKLETLWLSFCEVTEEGCMYLASALSSNPSHLTQLDLSYNYLQEAGLKLIALLEDPLCKLKELSMDHNAECYLKSRLKNYACKLTFDTNTAATSLFLYDGESRVTWVRETQHYPDHPERFESVSQVLCQEGLTQRHYWEADWRGRWVDIAVAMRGIHRRAGSHLCGFGYTEQSWSLYCSEDHYTAQHDHEPVKIPAPLSCSHRVGVYLDWPGGTLSFYRVSSGTLTHLHTFNSTFTEPLYAGFAMEEDDCSITICTAEARSRSPERVEGF
ncbi:NACHT, LRR and PYD domains-containing protein 12-like isoform X2 [Genypterus blacodes]|uniref:NACHT, LRR and PYD domains-containing protein 12-like isoform X2 n=1 Tax=Genypterus blacodes TaxID=154954 RepID=UPI003F771F34